MKRKLKQMRPAAAYVIAILAFVLICFVVGRIPTGDSVSQPEGDFAQNDTSGIPWNLILVTNDLALPEDFSVQLATLSDYRNEQVDARILQDLTTMLNDMEQAGLEPLVCSSYRDYNRQMQLFNQERDEFTQQGMKEVVPFSDSLDALRKLAMILIDDAKGKGAPQGGRMMPPPNRMQPQQGRQPVARMSFAPRNQG